MKNNFGTRTHGNPELLERLTAMHKPINKLKSVMSEADVMVVATPAKEAIFAEWIDGELEKLVAKWIHLAAPNATRPRQERSSRDRS